MLSSIKYSLIADPALPALLEKARNEERTEQEAAEVAELQRMYNETSKIPAQEYAAFVKLTTAAVNAWEKAKAASDFSLFAPYLEQIVAYRRRTAAYFDANKAPYDVWLDQYEKGLSMAQCDAFFDRLKAVTAAAGEGRSASGARRSRRFPAGHLAHRGPEDALGRCDEADGHRRGPLRAERERAPLHHRVLQGRRAHHHPLPRGRHGQQPVLGDRRGRPRAV